MPFNKIFGNENAIKPHFGTFLKKVGNFESGWEILWEFLDFRWKLLGFGSINTDYFAYTVPIRDRRVTHI